MFEKPGISKIQKDALQRLLKFSGTEYEVIVKEALNYYNLPIHTTIPVIDDLSYKEALYIIKYGNNIILGRMIPT